MHDYVVLFFFKEVFFKFDLQTNFVQDPVCSQTNYLYDLN